eukprot:TRINITY_DN735_c0_g1_i2.p1 TRINITY_DN735_c0_g1~~TRINITY_DN735_c0_g1_i2.p1  ORF type:complete len:765 (+),score=123.45 TRINITY_DN735_c0_g1_i2:291-2585(+)
MKNSNSVPAARLLRTITVSDKARSLLTPSCSEMVIALSKSENEQLRIALTATIWNMACLPTNRKEMMNTSVLNILEGLVPCSGELVGEIIGCLRTFALDDDSAVKIVESKNLVGFLVNSLIPKDEEKINDRLMWNLLDALSRLTSQFVGKDKCHQVFLDDSFMNSVTKFLEVFSTIKPSSQSIMLDSLINLTKYSKFKENFLNTKLVEILTMLLDIEDEGISKKSEEILSNLYTGDAEKIKTLKRKNFFLKNGRTYFTGLLSTPTDEIQESNVILKKKLGEGAYGSVHLAEFHGYPVACKIIKNGVDKSNIQKILEELRLMRQLKHPNIVLLIGMCVNSENQIMIVTEYASRGDMSACLKKIKSITIRIKIIADVAAGLCWIQKYNITHRDLKLDNLLVSEDWTVKIADFGLSVQVEEGSNSSFNFGGNIKYSAPEILKERAKPKGPRNYQYGEKTDMWSFGLLWFHILTRIEPYRNRPEEYKGNDGLVKWILEGNRPTIVEYQWPKKYKEIMMSCWDDDPNKRPTFQKIVDSWDSLTMSLLCQDNLARKVCKKLWSKDITARPSTRVFFQHFYKECFISKSSSTASLKSTATTSSTPLNLSRKASATTILPKKDSEKDILIHLFRESPYDDYVTFTRFCHIINWFGPLNKQSNNGAFFKRANDLLSKEYFFGVLDDTTCTNLITSTSFSHGDESYSTAIIRYSFDDIGAFELDYFDKTNSKFKSLMIKNEKGELKMKDTTYSNWRKLKKEAKKKFKISSFCVK